ncbi:hypothetical protein M1L60_19845 [Actinoplanes sp. TRM 88003]|uniref:Uncharacterized protein n=1 Tax=Paractinoplanes aksuensis TaxID=2939490 RepID=A0ABT1DPT2_9ACTN|nr:hypothetical protein [Actinoplanes aksuensis]MCO8272851.1 hypothetical protein [Actinoplanes aksuensis]
MLTPQQRNFVERTMAGRAATSSVRRRWITAGAITVAAGVVGAVVVPALVPGAAEKAVASWTAMPTARTDEFTVVARSASGETTYLPSQMP